MNKYNKHIHIPGQFSLHIRTNIKNTKILMESKTNKIYTKDLPKTASILKKFLPSIFNCECFNYNNHSFLEEVQNTELGHLFEHIILEFLCLKKLERGYNNALYEGHTTWNWTKDKSGTFYIEINAGEKDSEIFNDALNKSVALTSVILGDSQTGGQVNHLLD